MELKADNISVALSGTEIVKDISLRVKEKQFVGLIGPNGCGKSTLLKSIYKVIKPKAGSVYLDTMNVLNTAPKIVSKALGVVGQFNEMSFDFTVWEMVLMGRTPHKGLMEADTSKDYDLVREALSKVSLAGYEKRSYLSLSGGEKQRVVLARAIAQEPEFLILDEPTNHLDIKYQLQILNIVKNMNIGTLAALHDLALTAKYCDYIYAVKKGKIAAEGRPEEVLTKKLIQEIYEVECEIYENPVTGGLGIAYLG